MLSSLDSSSAELLFHVASIDNAFLPVLAHSRSCLPVIP